MNRNVLHVRRPAAVLCALAVGFSSLSMASSGESQTASGVTRDASSWPLLAHDPQMTGFNSAERIVGPASVARLHAVWSARYVYQALATATRVYAITQGPATDTRLLVLEARSGRVLHAYSAAAQRVSGYPGSVQDTWFQSLAYAGHRLVVGTTNEVIAIDPETAHVHWRVRGGAFDLTIQGGIVYTTKSPCQNPCGEAADSAIDLQTGRVRWKHPNRGRGPMLLAAGRLVQQDLSTLIGPPGPPIVYDPRSGRLLGTWSRGAGGVYWTGDAASVYVTGPSSPYATAPSRGKRCRSWVRRLSARGHTVWDLCLARDLVYMARPVLAYRTLYTASERKLAPPGRHGGGLPPTFSGSVVAISTDSGRVLWRSTHWQYPGGFPPDFVGMVAANHLLFVETRGPGELTVLDAGTGRLIRRFPAPGYRGQPDSWPLLIAGGTLYAGHLTAFRP